MTYHINDYSRGAELTLTRKRLKANLWESYSNYPETGLVAWYGTFGNSEIYGYGVAIAPFVNFDIFRWGNLNAQYHVALGMGYANKPFDIRTNPYNTVFGSHFNAYLDLGLLLSYQLTDKLAINSSVSLSHLSNGATRKPNHGVNTATLAVGAAWRIDHNNIDIPPSQPTPRNNAREWLITGSMGFNQSAAYNPTRYWSGSITTNHLWYRTLTRAYSAGFDIIHLGGAPLEQNDLQYLPNDLEYGFWDNIYLGVTAGQQAQLGTTSLYLNLGAYVYYQTKPRQPAYCRLGIRQRVYKNWLAHFGIKASFFTAEFIEFGIGYRIPYKKNRP